MIDNTGTAPTVIPRVQTGVGETAKDRIIESLRAEIARLQEQLADAVRRVDSQTK